MDDAASAAVAAAAIPYQNSRRYLGLLLFSFLFFQQINFSPFTQETDKVRFDFIKKRKKMNPLWLIVKGNIYWVGKELVWDKSNKRAAPKEIFKCVCPAFNRALFCYRVLMHARIASLPLRAVNITDESSSFSLWREKKEMVDLVDTDTNPRTITKV